MRSEGADSEVLSLAKSSKNCRFWIAACWLGATWSRAITRSGPTILSLLIPAIRTLKLGPRAAELVLVNGQTQLIPIVWLRINGMCQSARPAFQCPGCGHNRFKLFYRHGRFSGCYRCNGVPYASQQCSTKNRSRLQAARLRLFLEQLARRHPNPRQTGIDG